VSYLQSIGLGSKFGELVGSGIVLRFVSFVKVI
jgi:hypothetical protein